MRAVKVSKDHCEAFGTIEHIDCFGRELTLSVGDSARVFGLAPECVFLLHGEPVKLRLLQPLDRAHLCYRDTGGALVAHSVRVP
jgi:hypothetical protein